MELLEVSEAAMAKYFTMMLDGTARTWLKGLPPNSIGSWAELKARFIQNFKDTCRQSMSIVDLTTVSSRRVNLRPIGFAGSRRSYIHQIRWIPALQS